MPKGRLRRILLTVLVSTTLVTPALSDPPPAGSTLQVGYAIAFWAVPFGHTDYDGTLAANSYSAKVHFETFGLVSMFWNSAIDATVNGDIGTHSISPAIYDSYSQDRDEPIERVKVTFENDNPTTFADPPYNMTKYPVNEEQKKGTVDPMSAITSILAGVKADAEHPCGTDVKVFDGRRRYDLTFAYLKDEPVKLSNGLFNGNAHLCQIYFNHIAGYKQKIVKQSQNLPKMFADFADIPAAGAPNGHYVVAVRLWSTQSLGTITVTLDTIKVDGMAPLGMSAKS
jgi:hypothetical protein